MPVLSPTITDYLDYNFTRTDAGGRKEDFNARIHYQASGWVPHTPGDRIDPPEGGLFEDMKFLTADIDPTDTDCAPMTAAEIIEAEQYFHSQKGHEEAQNAAITIASRDRLI